jgi:hypothetical protein
MYRLWIGFAVLWAVLLPPFFTDGACTAELDAKSKELASSQPLLATPQLAQRYWSKRGISMDLYSPDQRARNTPPFVQRCGPGVLAYAVVPVHHSVCRIYRDDGIAAQLHYDRLGYLTRIVTDMNPFKMLPLPLLGATLYWAR